MVAMLRMLWALRPLARLGSPVHGTVDWRQNLAPDGRLGGSSVSPWQLLGSKQSHAHPPGPRRVHLLKTLLQLC